MPRTNRTEKLDLRLTAAAKETLTAAAESQRRSLSEFVLESVKTLCPNYDILLS